MNPLYVVNPATGESLEEIEETEISRVPEIYIHARQAFDYWSGLSLNERLSYLQKLKFVMVEHMEELATTIVKDNGKVPTEALIADIMPTLDAINYLIKQAPKVLTRKKVKTPILFFGKKSYIEYMPRGVVLVISPWNYPLQLSIVPVLSALVSGNTVILKPSEVTPLVGKFIERLFEKSGFPKDVVQVVYGDGRLGSELSKGNPDYIFFTGSVQTGKMIQEVAAKQLIPTTLELGGKDPFIVFNDANIIRAAKGAVWAAFTNTGQVCMSAERVFIQRKIYDQFLHLVKQETEKLVLGVDEDADLGSMTFPKQKEIVKNQVVDALEKGAELLTGNAPDNWDDSLYLKPMVITNITKDMKLYYEETFGPVMPVIPFDTEDEVIELANGTNYGLNASVWTQDIEKAKRVASKLISGAVTINEALISVANHDLPFGGAKNSGIGRYHAEVGLTTFCHEKAIMIDSGKKKSEIQWYPYKGKYADYVQLFKNYFGKKKNVVTLIKSYLNILKKSRN